MDLSGAAVRFPGLRREQDGRTVVFADAPGGSQVPDVVIEAMADYLRRSNANAHGAFATSQDTDHVIEEAHRAAADLLNADADEVVFGPNATTLLFAISRSIARSLGPGDEVVVTRLDHDANIRPWAMAARDAGATVRWADVRPDDVTLDLTSLAEAITHRTRLVACTAASNAVGSMPPVAEVVRLAKAVDALVAIDAVHLAQHHAPDLHGWGADVVATSPYKFFGPHQGMVGVRRELLASWQPYKLDAAEDVDPHRWESGTQSHEAMAGTIAAIGYIAEGAADRRDGVVGGFARFHAHERLLAARFLEGAAAMAGLRLAGIADPARVDERTPTFAIRLGDQHPLDTAAALADRGIFVWDGHYYAIEVFERLGLLASGGAVRIGFCHYHTLDEVDRVLDALADLV